jgi:hypothetical protein
MTYVALQEASLVEFRERVTDEEYLAGPSIR